jgi:hypothetical protein
MRSLLTIAFFALTPLLFHGQGRIVQRITDAKAAGQRFVPVSLFTLEAPTMETTALWADACTKADVLRYDRAAAERWIASAPELIRLSIPTSNGSIELELKRSEILADDIVARESNGERPIEIRPAMHYRGIVSGDQGSVASVSIFGTEFMALISDASGERIIGRFDNGPQDLHVAYHENALRSRNNFICSTPEGDPYRPEQLESTGERTLRCVRFYWESAYAIYLNKNSSVVDVTNYLTGLFNQSATLYDNDGIDVLLSEIYVWSTTSPYNATTSSGRLSQFGTVRTSFNGDLAHLMDLSSNLGGVAWLETLCESTNYRMAYSGINSSFSNVPTYSWTVEVVTHEQGHNLGSQHTHACAWNGNNTAIDGCGQSVGYSEGSCSQGPIPSSATGGTIMSYCHLTGTGINFANGFGPQPTAVIVNNVNAASCLLMCGSSCDAPLVSVSVQPTSATFTWTNVGATNYELQWKLSSNSTWTTVSGLTGTMYTLNGLTAGNTYNYRMRSNCGGTLSAYTATANFSTPVPCTDPYESNNSTGAATIVTLPATINALIGSNTDADYFRFTTDQTATINITMSNLAGDYDVRLLNSGGTQIGISENANTTAESITYNNAAASTYYVHVYGWNGAMSTTQCYLLNISISGAQGCGTPTGLGAANITSNSAQLTWNAMQGATSYDVQWRQVGAPGWTNINGVVGTSTTLSGLTTATNYEFRVRANCSAGASLYSNAFSFTTLSSPCSPGVDLTVSVWLDGPYDASTQLMKDDLRAAGLVPLTEPYTALGFVLTGATTTTSTILNATGSTAVVDWVLIELRDASNPATIVDSRAGLLRRNGTITSPSGATSINFCAFAGNYKIAVRHRTHLGCMTSGNVALSSSPATVDLRSNSTSTYGSEARKGSTIMTLWPGNVNSDLSVKYSGVDNDRDLILNAIGGTLPTNVATGYLSADVNMDGVVKYTGAANDRDVILTTVGGSVPTQIRTQQLP